jgi:hypothetical protein
MLRGAVIAIGALCLVGGVVSLTFHVGPPALVFGIWGGVLIAGIVYERFRYKPIESSLPGGGWVETTERFIDDETGKPVTVYLHSATGERKYVGK